MHCIWIEGIHPVAILSGKENYVVLQTAGKELFKDINGLIPTGNINVNGKEIKLEFYLGGDYKVSQWSQGYRYIIIPILGNVYLASQENLKVT